MTNARICGTHHRPAHVDLQRGDVEVLAAQGEGQLAEVLLVCNSGYCAMSERPNRW